jgi:hypothetical protein
MRAKLTTAMLVLAVTLVAAAAAWGDELTGPSREEYVAQVDPICKANTDANRPLLTQARKLGKAEKYASAAGKVSRVASNFGKSIASIEAVPRPTEDSVRLRKWFGFLRIVRKNLNKVSIALRQENDIKAKHEEIRVERSSNAANNVSFVFGFKYCHLKSN